MLIIRSEDNSIIEMFDTVKEFKIYIEEILERFEEILNEREDYFFYLLDEPLEDACFENKFKKYKEITKNDVEVR